MTKRAMFGMYPVHAVLPNFSVEFEWKLIYNGHTFEIPTVEYEEGGCSLEEFKEVKSSEMGALISRSSDLLALIYSIALTSLRDRDEQINKVHDWINTFLLSCVTAKTRDFR